MTAFAEGTGLAMVWITYLDSSGTVNRIEVPTGWSVMEGAVRNGVPGLPADCGGSCACGTCRVMVDEQWLSRLDDANDLELATIEIHEDTLPGQRLSCQIPVTPELDGIVVRIPGDCD